MIKAYRDGGTLVVHGREFAACALCQKAVALYIVDMGTFEASICSPCEQNFMRANQDYDTESR